jgi:hypothetical protein
LILSFHLPFYFRFLLDDLGAESSLNFEIGYEPEGRQNGG